MTDTTAETRSQLSHEEALIESTVRLWWIKRKLIATVLSIAIVVFAAILLLIPRLYKAQASVIIMPPRFAPAARAVPLAVPTAQNLLETQELYQQVLLTVQRERNIIERLNGGNTATSDAISKIAALSPQDIRSAVPMTEEESKDIADLSATEIEGILEFKSEELDTLNVDSVGEKLSSAEAVEKKTASELVYSPVLKLFAVSDSGPKAQLLVNTWARLFEKKYEELTRGQTQRLYASLEGQQESGQSELESIQKILVDFKLKNNLDLIQRQIRDKSETFSSFSQQLIGRNNELNGLKAKLNALVELTTSLEEPNFGWVGTVRVDSSSSAAAGMAISFADSESYDTEDTPSTISLLRKEVIRSRNDLMQAIDTASSYHSLNPLPLLQAEDERIRREYVQQLSDYRTTAVLVEVLRQSIEQLNRSIDNTSSAVSLSMALPVDVIGTAAASGRAQDVQRLSSIKFDTEHLNPKWQQLVQQHTEESRQLAIAEAAVAQLKVLLPAKEFEVKRAGERAFQAEQGDTLARQQVERFQSINKALFQSYGEMKEQLFSTGLRITLLEQEINTMNQTVQGLNVEIERLRESYEAAAAEIEVLNLKKKAIEQRAELLTTKLQESVVAIGEQVSDVSIASKAVAPVKHFWPPRSAILAAMTAVTAFLLLGGLSRRRYRELLGPARI